MAWHDFITKRLPGLRGSTSVGAMSTAGTSAEDLYSQGYYLTNEKSPSLRGRRKYQTYNALVTNTMIAALGMRYFLTIVAGTSWTWVPPKDEDDEPVEGAQEVADFVTDVFTDMESSWRKVVRRAARFRFNGFSWQEWTAKQREDGKLGFKDIEPRPCGTIERWDLDEGNSVLGVTQMVNGKPEVYLPRGKALYLVDDVLEDHPEGTGMLRHIVRNADRLRAYEELEELAFETDLRGIPIGRAPIKEMRDAVTAGKMSSEQVKKARQPVDNFVRNKLLNKTKGATLDSETYLGTSADGGVSPSSVRKFDVELLKGESSGQAEVDKSIQRVNLEIARLLGIEHLMLGSDGTGSLALIGGKLSSFFLLATSTLTEIGEQVDRDLVATICELNGIPKELWPKSTPAEIDVTDIEALARVLAELATAGATLAPDDPAIDTIRGRAGLPPQPEPPELSEEDQALIDRQRMGLVNPPPVDPNKPEPNAPEPKPGTAPKKGEKQVKPGSEGSAAQRELKKLLKTLLGDPGDRGDG